jgi:ribosomal protein S18 acetylase RimI-like enzyme
VTPGGEPREIVLRHPTEEDQPAIAAVIDDWFGGRRVVHLAGRTAFRHNGSTSWIATTADGKPAGILLGFRSQDHPTEAVIVLVAVDPNRRRHGIGRRLIEAFVGGVGVGGPGASEAVAVAWPGEPRAIAFFRGTGFVPDSGPGTRSLWGTPAYPDYEAPGDDRIVFRRPIA